MGNAGFISSTVEVAGGSGGGRGALVKQAILVAILWPRKLRLVEGS